jgi:succinoglycan biosynthesis protein ExoA
VTDSGEPWPLVSVVMPVRNEAAFIARNLEAVLAQDYPADRIEVLVADGRSDDGTREIVGDLIARTRRHGAATGTDPRAAAGAAEHAAASPIVLIDNPDRIMPAGTNAAIRQARGEIVLLLGGHAALPPGYIRACARCLRETGADCVGGAMISVGDGAMGEAIAAAMSSPFGIGNSAFRTTQGEAAPVAADTVPFGAYRRDVFARVGLFNPGMVRHQDYEFNYRLRRAGGRILLLPSLKAVYHVRSTLAGLWRQYWQYGIWKGRFVRRFPASLRPRHLAPSVLALALAAGAALAPRFPAAGLALAAIAALYAAFLLLALASFAFSGRARLIPALLLVLPCLHFGYGLGVWLGLLMPRVADAPTLEIPARG